MRPVTLALLALTLASCGSDGTVPPREDASLDGGASDGAASDGAVQIDSGTNPGACSPGCGSTQFCELPACTATSGGTCVDKPGGICSAIAMPQCGCDGHTYGNTCERQSAGVSKLKDGPCECTLTPPLSCCFSNDDCRNSGGRCANATCSQGGAGKCVPAPLAGTCWIDRDCTAPMVCKGASICGCGQTCIIGDRPGTCGAP
jgi:hypothetical protein